MGVILLMLSTMQRTHGAELPEKEARGQSLRQADPCCDPEPQLSMRIQVTYFLGPLINERQTETFSKQVQHGIDEGAKVVLRGNADGNVASPTVFADVKPDLWIAQNEMFGPAVCVLCFVTEEEGVQMANNSPYGLSGAIHTRDVEHGAELAKHIESGMVQAARVCHFIVVRKQERPARDQVSCGVLQKSAQDCGSCYTSKKTVSSSP
jgi:acyl-CoA reductase-like NAD-dependent aldehyde dehydrogenase